MMYKMILTICFSLFLLTGCTHTTPVDKAWIMPKQPTLEQPNFQKEGDRLFLDKENAISLRNSLLEMKAYQKKLEFLVKEMKDYYSAH